MEYGKIICKVSHVNGILGIFRGGNPPSIDAISPTVVVEISQKYTIPKMVRIAVNAAGIIFVIFGKPQIISIAVRTSPKKIYNSLPCIQGALGSVLSVVN